MRPTRAQEMALLAAVLLVSAAVRLVGIGGYGFQHFDERPYAFEAARLSRVPWTDLVGERRLQVTYAPPLFPVLVSVPFRLVGISDTAAIATSALMGVAGVALLYGLVRRLLGPLEALAAAAILAVTEFHVIYSRMALTETTFFALFVAALWAFVVALERGRRRDFVLAGLCTLAAMWSKYSAGCILPIALLYLLLLQRGRREALVRSLRGWLVSAAVVVVGFLPWLLYVHAHTGWAAFRAHRATYTRVGLGSTAYAIAFAGQCLVRFVGWHVVVLALVGLVVMVWGRERDRAAGLLWVAWLAGYGGPLLFYLPYPRLSLPLVPLLVIPAVVVLRRARAKATGSPTEGKVTVLRWSLAVAGVAALSLVLSMDTLSRRPTGYRDAAKFVARQTNEGLVVRACQAPLDFYLTLARFPQERFTALTSANRDDLVSLARAGEPMLVVGDYYLKDNPQLRSAVLEDAGMRELVAFENDVLDVILLDGGFEVLRLARRDPEDPSVRLYTHVVVYARPGAPAGETP